MYSVYFYTDQRGAAPVWDFLEDLDKRSRAKIARYIGLLEQHGPDLIRPYADHVRGPIRELRVRVVDGNVRILYFFFVEKKIILLHAFRKKTQELPEREIARAECNKNNYLEQFQRGEAGF